MTDKNTLIKELTDKIKKNSGNPSDWYTGIATDPKERLSQHKTDGTSWIYDQANSSDIAREVEKHMIDVVGTKGGSGGGGENSDWVYCYRITSSTVEDTG